MRVRTDSADSLLTEARGPSAWQTTTYVYGVPVHRAAEMGNWQQAQLSVESKSRSHRATVRAVFAAKGAVVGFAAAHVVPGRTSRCT